MTFDSFVFNVVFTGGDPLEIQTNTNLITTLRAFTRVSHDKYIVNRMTRTFSINFLIDNNLRLIHKAT